MTPFPRKHGFTLLEILVAITIFGIIISVVYGSYFAASQSAHRCQTKIAQSRQARTLLTRMARQIRCCYIKPTQNPPADAENKYSTTITRQENPNSFFRGGTDLPDRAILHFTTTHGVFSDNNLPSGPFEIAYKYDAPNRRLYYHQQKFVPNAQTSNHSWNWSLLAQNVAQIELTYFDGQRWLTSWSLNDKNSPPQAVKITLQLFDPDNNPAEFSTIAPLAAASAETVLLADKK